MGGSDLEVCVWRFGFGGLNLEVWIWGFAFLEVCILGRGRHAAFPPPPPYTHTHTEGGARRWGRKTKGGDECRDAASTPKC